MLLPWSLPLRIYRGIDAYRSRLFCKASCATHFLYETTCLRAKEKASLPVAVTFLPRLIPRFGYEISLYGRCNSTQIVLNISYEWLEISERQVYGQRTRAHVCVCVCLCVHACMRACVGNEQERSPTEKTKDRDREEIEG